MEHLCFMWCLVFISITGSCHGCAVQSENGPPVGWELSSRRSQMTGLRGRPESVVPADRTLMPSLVSKTEDFNLIDTDSDGQVTRLEWQQAFEYLLENYDKNGDRMISLSELDPDTPLISGTGGVPPNNIGRPLPSNIVRVPPSDTEIAPLSNNGAPSPARPSAYRPVGRPHPRKPSKVIGRGRRF